MADQENHDDAIQQIDVQSKRAFPYLNNAND